MSTPKWIRWKRANIVSQRINLEKDFFTLNNVELDDLEFYKKIFNFDGRNQLGRSELRQFYYHLQKGYKELPF